MKLQIGTIEVSDEARKALSPDGKKLAKREVVHAHLVAAMEEALKKLEGRGIDAVRSELEAKRAKLAEQQRKVDDELRALGSEGADDYEEEPLSVSAFS